MADQQVNIGEIGWIDLTVPNATEVKDFYRAVVGYSVEEVDMGGYSDYTLKTATEKAAAGVCHARGSNTSIPPQWLLYMTVADIDASVKECHTHGGEVIVPIRDMGSYGRFCVVKDPGGAVAGLLEPAKAAQDT